MRKGFARSILFHTMVMVVGYFGLPELRRDLSMTEAPIMVEIVTVAETTNAPALKPAPKRQPPPPKTKPPPKPPKVASPPPPAPKPKPEVAAVPSPPETIPKPKAKPRPQVPPRLVKAKPKRKPKPPDTFASVLKTVKELHRQKPKPKEKSEKKKDESFERQTAKALASLSRRYDTSRPLTISEIDLVRQQIAGCWNLPAGAKDAENLVIEIWVAMNPDGTVRQARIKQQQRMLTDSFFRAAAESALRAVLNKRCQPFKLPRKKYDRWKTMTLVFNPKEMFGA
ncbi:MAG: energy transducer TonB [Rhodospirillales bacterium]|nr:energy transducer TonB [Rhodospirillales bacterium]